VKTDGLCKNWLSFLVTSTAMNDLQTSIKGDLEW